MENAHKRGRSFESALMLRAKDDDLALFNDMQNKEKENFLLQTADDFDDSLSKLRYHSEFKLGITIPARGESSDLLNADSEKNDYDWLLTPPDTPLFSSLDDEELQPQNLAPRGRPRSLPINIARSPSMNDKTRKTSRSSASPRRLSPSPRSSNNFGQLVSRPSSAPRSSPPPIVRPGTPSRRPSTPPNKPSTPTPRSSTPTLRRMSTGSSGQASSTGRRGASPMRASRGNSASPKLQSWQSNLPGFSSDVPPNLRTSVSDRPSPHVRGLSPTPRSGRGRHSMSPTASRSVSSSHSNDRDMFSSYSKGSVVSSGDDDVDSLHSMAISSSPPARRNGMSLNSRPMAFSKKPSRTSPSNSVPKRSFDSVLRQTDHRKTPQNMFRPLLSSVPSTTFYVGKSNTTHRPMFSRNSSLTTSTSASSDQGASVAPDMDGNEHDQNDLTGGWERRPDPNIHEEMFVFDKVEDVMEDGGEELHARTSPRDAGNFDADMSNKVDAPEFEEPTVNLGGADCLGVAAESTQTADDLSVVDGCEIMAVCFKCGKRFRLLEMEGGTDICRECIEMDGIINARESLLSPTLAHNQALKSEITTGKNTSVEEGRLSIGIPELTESSNGDVILGPHENNTGEGLSYLDNSSSVQSMMDERGHHHPDQLLDSPQDVSSTQSDIEGKSAQAESTSRFSLKIDNPEGTGISILLQRSNNNNWPVVQSRSFSATNILCAEPSYTRDNTSYMRRSIGRDSASGSSSVDMGSSRQTDAHIQRQISSRKFEESSVRSGNDAKSQCSSYFDLPIDVYESSFPSNGDNEEFNRSTMRVENEDLEESVTREPDNSLGQSDTSAANLLSCTKDFVESDGHIDADCFVAKDTSDSELLSHMERHHCETLAADNLNVGCSLCTNAKEGPWGENATSSLDIEELNNVPDLFIIAEQSVLNSLGCRSDISDTGTHSSSVVILESQKDHESFHDLHGECGSAEKPSNEGSTYECSASATFWESDLDDSAHGIHEESSVTVEGLRGRTSRSLTLAEATDTILFCSSIIHDIAYKAVTIAMEKELVPLEASRPRVTIVGKTVNGQKDLRKIPSKPTAKSQKFKRKKLETQIKTPLTESGNNVIVPGPANAEHIPPKAPDSVKPPKLESKCNCTVM